MCKDCGCGSGKSHAHTHADGTVYTHTHDHDRPDHQAHAHVHGKGTGTVRSVDVQERVLARNDRAAAENRAWLAARGIVAVNLISSPGSGKTLLLERTLERLREKVGCAVIVGDQQTDHDKQRLIRTGVPVEQIETGSACHLDAEMIGKVLPGVIRENTRLLFIENVGNMICPAAFDLGETFKVALLSATEGEDKPVKYPVLFSSAQVVVLTKLDLVPHLEWDLARCRRYIQAVHPGVFVFELSARTGDGLDSWCRYLQNLI